MGEGEEEIDDFGFWIGRGRKVGDRVSAKMPSCLETGSFDSEKLCVFAPLREKILMARAKPQRRKGRWVEW